MRAEAPQEKPPPDEARADEPAVATSPAIERRETLDPVVLSNVGNADDPAVEIAHDCGALGLMGVPFSSCIDQRAAEDATPFVQS